jgi:hypothetical protein
MREKILVLSIALCATSGFAAEIEWQPTLEAGRAEASRASRAIFLVTMWKDTV